MNIIKISLISTAISLVSLIGCDGGNSLLDTDYSSLKRSPVSEKPLITTSNRAFERYLKNGIRARLAQKDYPEFVEAPVAQEGADNTSEGGGFSTTNVHELGVDEADRIKYDGKHLYIVKGLDTGARAAMVNGGNSETIDTSSTPEPLPEKQDNKIRILRTNAQSAFAEEVSVISNSSNELAFSDIYMRPESSQLISLSNTQYYAWNAFLPEDDWRWDSGKVEIQSYDVSNTNAPGKQWKIELEGNLQGSRRVADKLYLITRYIPNIASINYAATSDNEKRNNEELIVNTPLSDLLPHYQANDGAIKSLVAPGDCLVSEDITEKHGYADVVTLTAIDLDDHSISSSVCLNTNVQGVYSSTSGFYIGGTSAEPWFDFSNLTAIHKFALNDGNIKYKASAALPGFLGWSDPSFRMDEVNDDLRIVTSDFRDFQSGPDHQLTILREDGSRQLQVVSTLPNKVQASPIGKPGEDIFSIRFTDERAYIVTFEKVDPLYVIDLKDPTNPKIAGELEIPGFSRYLHAIADDWLLGIGNEVENGQQKGVKVELYDIRDMTQPKVKNTLVIGGRGSSSEALYDLRALSLLEADSNTMRLTFPVDVWKGNGQFDNEWKESGLFGFDISNDDSGEYELSFSGKIVAESSESNVNQNQSYPLNSGIGRGVIHNDAVFYLHGNEVFSDIWGSWDNLQGPF